ncbi:uncharacterized protein G2W53_003309 [Senna tora]|uniref:Uncharacterized protein n=1 Tax=Senna tora TaxID=362788 RepID=A0A834X9J8_9FABA|nr:uncharacterized protein G2W53_003309 [Senna tora]
MPKPPGKTSTTILKLRASHQGSNKISRLYSLYAKVKALEISVAELQIYLLQTLELRSYALQILHHLGIHSLPPATTPSAIVTTPVSHWRGSPIDVRANVMQTFLAERENLVAEMQSYITKISHHVVLHPQPFPTTPSISTTIIPTSYQLENSTGVKFPAIANSVVEVRDYLQQIFHTLGLYPQPPPAS